MKHYCLLTTNFNPDVNSYLELLHAIQELGFFYKLDITFDVDGVPLFQRNVSHHQFKYLILNFSICSYFINQTSVSLAVLFVVVFWAFFFFFFFFRKLLLFHLNKTPKILIQHLNKFIFLIKLALFFKSATSVQRASIILYFYFIFTQNKKEIIVSDAIHFMKGIF